MAQPFEENINLSQNIQNVEDLKKSRKVPNDQSLNTKNFIKKMTSKKAQPQQKAQQKITAYLNMSNSTSFGGEPPQNNQLITNLSIQDQRIKDLEQRMKQRDLQIERMKRAREIDENRYSNLFTENRENKKKTRENLAKSMLQAAQYKRAQRRQINPKLGYFKDGGRTFVQGTFIVSLKQRIKEKQKLIKEIEDEKKSKDMEKKQRANFKVQFIQKEIAELQKQLQLEQSYINLYKDKLKLADKQSNCQYSQKGWPIIFDHYQTLQMAGKGGFGQVYKCYDLESNSVVAVKVNHFNQEPQTREQFLKHVKRQADIMKKLSHPNIGKFIKLLECSGNTVTFALEYCSGPELSVYLKKNISLQQKQAKLIIKQVFSALNYLSSLKQKIIHYDLKPSNLMFHNGLIKLLDFGLCKPMGNQQSKINLTSQGIGTYWYLPPQTFDQHFPQVTPKVDVWSTGVIFYELLYGKKPFGHGITQDKIYNQGIILNAKKVEFPTQTPKKCKVSQSAKNFIRQCLAYDHQERLGPSEAYDHQYFKK